VKVGFVVNPVAGMGGKVGLKGTDDVVEEALRRGAKPVSPGRAKSFLEKVVQDGVKFLTVSAPMGEDVLEGFDFEIIQWCGDRTSASETKKACVKFMDEGVALIVFVGGDGTCRDVFSVVGGNTPVLGVPSGVKMHSSAFALNPEAAAEIFNAYVRGDALIREAEVVDVDEELYRVNKLSTKLFGIVKTPYVSGLMQSSKQVYDLADDEASKKDIARFAAEFMGDGCAYVLGAGSTTNALGIELGVDKTLLGVDVVKEGKLVVKDACEGDLLNLLEKESKVKVIVSPIGAQGFVFGRGTQPMSADVLKRVGAENVIYVATPHKLGQLRRLLVDTGDRELDQSLSGYKSVVVGYKLIQKKDVEAVT